MIPAPRLWLLVALAAAPHALAAILPGFATIGWAVDATLVAVAAADLALTARPRTLRARVVADRVVSLGVPHRVRIEVETGGRARGPARARVAFPEQWKAPEEPVRIALRRRVPAEFVVEGVPMRRGRFTIGPVHVRYASPLGLFRRDARCEASAEVRVYPAVRSIKKHQLLARRMRLREMGLRTQRIRGQGMEFARLREYQPDDDPRLIDWKATARRDHPISREYQVERSQTIMFMIDAGRMLTEEVDGLVKIEYALHAAMLLAHVAAEYDDRVGAIAFSDRIERSVAPRKGRAAVSALAEALFDLEPRLLEANYDLAFEHLQAVCRKRALVVLLTNVVDQETSGLVGSYLAATVRRHVPLCVALRDRETTEMAHTMPATEQEAYLKAGACRLLAARAQTLQSMHRQGVHVIDAVAGQVPVSLVNRYLDLKARQIL